MIIFFISAVPHFFLPWQDKVEIATGIVKDPNYLKMVKPTFLYEIFSLKVIYLSRPVLILAYTLWSAGLLIKVFSNRVKSRVLYGQRFMVLWLISLLSLIILLVTCHTVLLYKTFLTHDLVWFYTLNILQIVSIIGLFALLTLPFLFPAVLYGIPVCQNILNLPYREAEHPLRHNNNGNHNNIPHFKPDYLLAVGGKIEKCMSEAQPYLKHDFNLAQLSFMTSVPVHHLNYYFREVKKENFRDYRNKWRISYAKKLLLEGKASELTMETIGLFSGFTNRNTFLNAFKRVEGIAPSNFVMKKRPEKGD
jgi:AraC-like DNA-binding protein